MWSRGLHLVAHREQVTLVDPEVAALRDRHGVREAPTRDEGDAILGNEQWHTPSVEGMLLGGGSTKKQCLIWPYI